MITQQLSVSTVLMLISAKPSPWARKVRIVLIEKGISFELINDIPWATTTMAPEFNPLEKLPILVTGTGESVYESRFIVEWLDRRYPEKRMIPVEDDAFLACKKLELLVDGVLDASLLYFTEARRPAPDADWMARQRRKVSGGLAEVARLVGDRSFAVADHFTLADAAAGTMLASLDFGETIGMSSPEGKWRDLHPNLLPYYDGLARRRSFIETQPVWFEYEFSNAKH
jgi:glutathione S-transferase